jgi:hypothetical protein
MLIRLNEKSVYGNIMIYPSNEGGNIFAKLLRKKTFTHDDIELIKSLGHEVILIKLWN